MKLKKSNKFVALILLVATLISLVACSGVSIDKEVTKEDVNSSPENVCRAFFQSLYTEDDELFTMCFYDGVLENDSNISVYDQYQTLLDPELEFLGTKHIATRPCNIDNGYDYQVMKDNISVFSEIDENLIEDIQLVNVKVFFKLEDQNKSVELFSVVYRVGPDWYFFSIIDTTTRSTK